MALAVGLLGVTTSAISGSTIAVGAAGYVSVFLPLPRPLIIAGLILMLGAIAMRATRQAINVAGVMTAVEVGGLAVIIGAGLLKLDLATPVWALARALSTLRHGWA